MRMIGMQALVCLVCSAGAVAGGGHLHGYSGGHTEGAEEPVVLLGNDAVTNIDVRTLEVRVTPPTALRLGGVVERFPEGVVSVAAPTGGALTKIVAQPGEAVKRGAIVVLFSPFQIGAGSIPLLSPVDGVVGSVRATLGAGVETGTTLFSVVDPDRRAFIAPLTRGEIPALEVSVGDSVSITLRGDPHPFTGRIHRIKQSGVDGATIGQIAIELSPRDGVVAPLGAVGALVVSSRTAERVVVLPREAVVGSVVKPVVFVRRGNRFERRSVVLARDWGDTVEIARGLNEGELVVTRAAYQLNLARSDTFDKLTVGPHGGVVAGCASPRQGGLFAEVKLHDDKGDIEVWFGEDGDFKKPYLIDPRAKVSLRFYERSRSIDLAVRDLTSNNDETGVSRLKNGLSDYFIFPGESGSDATWLSGGEFIDEVTLTLQKSDETVHCETVTLVPHVHGEEPHAHGSLEAAHDHGHADDGHDHDHDHGEGHSH